jgi:hypothetical protein
VLDLLARLRDHQIGDHIFSARFAGLPERRSCAFDDLLGNADELAVFSGLMLMALLWGHPLNLLHPTPRRSRPISETLDTSASQRFGEVTDQARDNANDIPQQRYRSDDECRSAPPWCRRAAFGRLPVRVRLPPAPPDR